MGKNVFCIRKHRGCPAAFQQLMSSKYVLENLGSLQVCRQLEALSIQIIESTLLLLAFTVKVSKLIHMIHWPPAVERSII